MRGGKELLVGSVILAGVAVAVLGTFWLQGTNFGRTLVQVDVLLESVGQLQDGNVVTYRGVRLGQVGEISVEPGARAVRVVLSLDDGVELPTDAAVILGPESFFGDWQAEIVDRSAYPNYPFYEVPPGLPSQVRVVGGYALPELTRLSATAEQISQNLADLTDRMELAFNQETADNLARAIGNIEGITQELQALVAQQSDVATAITASADSALTEVSGAAEAARRSFEAMEGLMAGERLDSIFINIDEATAGLKQVATDLADPEDGLGVTLDRADSVFASLDRITAGLEAGEGSIGRLLNDPTLALRTEEVLLQLDLLLQDLRENPRRYVRLSIF